MNFPFRAHQFGQSRACFPREAEGHDAGLRQLPASAPKRRRGHDRDAGRLRLVAELHGDDGWLLGCREGNLRHGRRQIMVTPLEVLGTPSGTVDAALPAATARRCPDYVLAGDRP
jgi:hypothetical protein